MAQHWHFVAQKPRLVLYQRRVWGGSGTFPRDIGPMLVLHTLQQVTGEKQQDVLPFHIAASAGVLRAVE